MNLLIIESGSSKADWIFLQDGRQFQYETPGFNPATGSGLDQPLSSAILAKINHVNEIYYYGAGANSPASKAMLLSFFDIVDKGIILHIASDMLAAARACYKKNPAIVSILGTGSNSCVYDGEKIIESIPSLGYIVSDEGGGCHIGKEVIKAYFYGAMKPHDVAVFESNFSYDRHEIINQLYRKNSGAAYLANFSRFLQVSSTEFRQLILEKVFTEFVESRIKRYKDYHNFELYFVGSIASHYSVELSQTLLLHGLKIEEIIAKPIEKLVLYHKTHAFNAKRD